MVDWSYELLFDDEQRVFERLSVFPGGCDLATAEAVCADETVAADDLADLIHALVEKSLVIAVPKGDALRFTQLQTLSQYGRERLTERGDAERVRNAMAKHYAELCARSAAAYKGDQQRAWLTAIDQEHDNLRAALEWAVANDDAATALTIAGGTSWPHWLAGMVIEGKRWLDDAFGCAGDADERTRALALTGRGLLRRRWKSSNVTTTSNRSLWRTRFTPSSPTPEATATRLAGAGWSSSTSTASLRPTPSKSRRARTRSGSWRSWTATSLKPRCTTARPPKVSHKSIDP